MKDYTLQKKQAVVDEIKGQLENAKSVVIVEYRGLNVEEVTDLRNKYRAQGVGYKVYKNTMVALALQDLGYEGYEEYLTGPNGFVFSNEDMVSAAKVSTEYAKENEKLVVKAGLMDGKVMDAEAVKQLSKLPTKDVLLSMVLRGLNGPITGLAGVSQGILSQLVYALNAVKEGQEQAAA